MTEPSQILVFDRALARRHRDRAVAGFARHAVLFEEIAARLMERLGDVKAGFASILDLGARQGLLGRQLAMTYPDSFLVSAEMSEKMAASMPGNSVAADEELLPFAANSFDLVVSNLALHWVNDLPGTLAQIRHSLRPDGLFLATACGGATLHELRACLLDAELDITGGISPRLSPTIELPTASALLQRAGFALPVADQETVILTYDNAWALMRDLRGMGEANAHLQRLRRPTRRAVLMRAAELYQARFARPDGLIPATFEILFWHGWKPGST